MEKTVKKYIEDNNLITNNTIVIALSGGIDSMVLYELLKTLGYTLVIAHVNHNVRKESIMEYEKIKEKAFNDGVCFEHIVLPKIEQNFQEIARNMRYQFFMDVAKKHNTQTIVTAHHLDDLVETSLMKIIRGSNLLGYGGIKAKNNMQGFNFVRPLLCLTKENITSYANENHIAYYEDSSNKEDHYTRNRYRHHIIPLLKAENSNLYEAFTSFSNKMINTFNYIRSETNKYLQKWNNNILITEFNTLDIVIKEDIITALLENNSIENVAKKVKQIIPLLKNDKPNCSIDLGQEYHFIKEYTKAYICKKKTDAQYEIVIKEYGTYILPNNDEILFTKNLQNDNTNYINICYNKIMELPIIVRSRRQGDQINFDYGTKSVKKLLIEKKIPLNKRDSIPIVTDSKDNIIGIIGIGPKKGSSKDYLYLTRRNNNE